MILWWTLCSIDCGYMIDVKMDNKRTVLATIKSFIVVPECFLIQVYTCEISGCSEGSAVPYMPR